MTALNIAQPIFLQQKSTQLHKQKHPSQALFPPGTYFMPHINVAKTDLVFVNIFVHNLKNSYPYLWRIKESPNTDK